LTKYSTEYNNYLFIQELGQKLSMDKKDIITMFISLKNNYTEEEIILLLNKYEISKLDINRIYRYINNFLSNNVLQEDNKNIDDEDIINNFNTPLSEENEITSSYE
jgi:hypothetical protein